MDYNNINLRLKRIRTSIESLNKQGAEALGKMRTTNEKKPDGKFQISITFGDTDEALNQIHEVISSLANLKDIVKNRMNEQGKNPQLIEEDIDKSLALQLILDLSNQEKHGYPLTKTRRSGKDPKIINVRMGISPSKKPNNIRYSASDGSATFNMMINIGAEITDLNDEHLYTLDELVNQAFSDWESIIKFHQLA